MLVVDQVIITLCDKVVIMEEKVKQWQLQLCQQQAQVSQPYHTELLTLCDKVVIMEEKVKQWQLNI